MVLIPPASLEGSHHIWSDHCAPVSLQNPENLILQTRPNNQRNFDLTFSDSKVSLGHTTVLITILRLRQICFNEGWQGLIALSASGAQITWDRTASIREVVMVAENCIIAHLTLKRYLYIREAAGTYSCATPISQLRILDEEGYVLHWKRFAGVGVVNVSTLVPTSRLRRAAYPPSPARSSLRMRNFLMNLPLSNAS